MIHGLTGLLVAAAACASVAIAGSSHVGDAEARSNKTPAGVSTSDWSSIRAAYEANRHAAFAVDGGFQARNHAQSWLARFDGRSFVTNPDDRGWTWGLQLERYGFEGMEMSVNDVERVASNLGRVSYQWSPGLEEWFVNDRRGLEHGFTIQSRPEGEQGPLTLTLSIRGDLRPQVSSGGHDVSFVGKENNSVLNYSGLTVYDADGRTIPARFEADGMGFDMMSGNSS